MPDKGKLRLQLFQGDSYVPITDAKVTVEQVASEFTQNVKEQLVTDSSGLTEEIDLGTPPVEYSMEPSDNQPYSECNVKIEAEGYDPIIINGCQLYSDEEAVQECRLTPTTRKNRQAEIIQVNQPRLFGEYTKKIPEDPDKPLPPPPSGFVVLPEPVVPELVIVHDGAPTDATAPNLTIKFRDYIKNVACSEIYSTWPKETIKANVYCIISFTLNRVYTEWYRGKGYDFTITSQFLYDHAFSYGRTTYQSINEVVDEIFDTFIRRFGQKQPLLAQYCDGDKSSCPGWLTQWGSKYLGDQGKNAYEILTNFYGDDIEYAKASKVSGIPKSYPGYALKKGSTGTPVRTIQEYLNEINKNYPAIPKVAVDGVFGQGTEDSVKKFQEVFNYTVDGVVGHKTWYGISHVYVGVTRIGLLRESVEKKIFIPPLPCKDLKHIPSIEYEYDSF